ncbi:MAG: glycosyltransferase family 4 protein [Sulfurospirillaceae bacterium]|nr:glycosyltransferase family 4 protein [Sulfurospirillaceae bacterium]
MTQKILIVTEYFYPEEFKINEIALAWKDKGYEVDVLTQNPTYPAGKIYPGFENKWYSKEIYNGINIYRVKAVTGYRESLVKKLLKYFTFMFLGSIASLRIGKKYDHVFGFDIAALTCMVPAVLLKKFYKKPVTLWVQDVWPDSVYAYGFKRNKVLEFCLNGFVKFVYRHTSNFAISAKGFEAKIKPYLSERKEILYAPNWADTFDMNLEAFSFSAEKKVHFTFAGNIGKVQNLDNIITAFGNLKEEYLDKAQLNIIGDGSNLEYLKTLVKDNRYKNIIFWGKKPRDEMYKYFRGSDFLIVSLIDKPIFTLTVPAKTQTYIAANKPILGIIKGEAADIIKDNNLGFCAKPEDIEEISSVFMKAIDSDEMQIKEFTKNCENLTKTVFDKDNIITSLLNLLTKEDQ